MFADPQTVTIATVAKTLPAIKRGDGASTYSVRLDSGERVTLNLGSSTTGKGRIRTAIKLTRDMPVVSPAPGSVSYSVTAVADFPAEGVTVSNVADLAAALTGWLTPANVIRAMNGET